MMERVTLRGTGVSTSRLGFGCAGLTSLNDRKAAVRLLEHAFEAGVTHFDVARAYGFGFAEGIVGEFLAGRRDRVTVTTKFGMQPAAPSLARSRRLVGLAKKVLAPFPGLLARARRRSQAMVQTGAFTPAQAEASLTTSLRELRTDRVDLLLLHECTLDEARSGDLLAFLDDQVRGGTVASYGVGTATANLGGDLTPWPASYAVFQLENSAATPVAAALAGAEARALVTHSAVRHARAIADVARARPEIASRHEAALGVSLQDASAVGRLLLGWALRANADGIVLVGTTRPEHLRENVRVAEAPAMDAATAAALEAAAAELLRSDASHAPAAR